MNVLSLFDGISCGRLALERAGIKVDNYYASEIDKHAIKVTQHNYPDTIQLGDVTKIDFNQFKGKIDLLIGGSPCTQLSVAGNGQGLEGKESKLFYNYLDALKKIQPKYFLLENVKMKKVWEDIITDFMGVEPLKINSSLVSAQNRQRLYWTNIPNITQPEDKGILLKDIVHEYADNLSKEDLAPYIIDPKRSITILDKETEKGKIGYIGSDSQGNRIYNIHGKSVTLVGNAGGLGAKTGLYLFGCLTPDRLNKRQNGQRFNDGDKFYTLTAQDRHGVLTDGYIRKLTPVECERLQNLPDNYTELGEDVCYLNTYNIIKEREIACKSVKSMIATTPLQTEKQDYAINIICDLSDTEQPNLRKTQLSEMKNVLLTDVIDCNKQEADYVLNTIKDLREQVAQMLNKKNRKNVNIAIDWQLQEGYVTSIIKTGLDTETHNIQINLDKETMHMDTERLRANIKYNIEKSLRKCSDEICCLKKLYTILILINLIIIKKIYMFAVKENTQVYTSSSIKLQGNLLSVALSNSKMVSILPISKQQRYKCLGNGWTVDVIAHIFRHIPAECGIFDDAIVEDETLIFQEDMF